MKGVIVAVFEAARLTVSEEKTDTMLLQTRDLASRAPPSTIEVAGQKYKQKCSCYTSAALSTNMLTS